MHNLNFSPSPYRRWSECRREDRAVWVAGWAFIDKQYLAGEGLALYIANEIDSGLSFSAILQKLNGNFAAIVDGQDEVHIGVDAVRSIPLFYRRRCQSIWVSDDFRLIQQEADTLDWDSVVECATAGYVTGPYTLYVETKGVQCGECISWSAPGEKPRCERYYRYVCSYDSEASVETLCEHFDGILVSAFERLVHTFEGRQIVVPLSGGLDSRLVASMLKRCGYENVLCLSYGVPGNTESVRSRMIADSLGYQWVQMPYSGTVWKEAMGSRAWKEYWAMSSNGVSGPHCDEWPAIYRLKKDAALSDDAIFVPGHTGDFICGDHLKYVFDPTWNDGPSDFDTAIIDKHYSLWDDLIAISRIRDVIGRRLAEILDAFSKKTDEDLACMYEYWEWQERQTKLIVNAVRVYDFFGYDWRIPLWDRSIMEFWKHIPIALKMNKFLYRTYLASYDSTGVFVNEEPGSIWRREHVLEQRSKSIRIRVGNHLKFLLFIYSLWRRYQKIQKFHQEYKNHPLGVSHTFGKFRFLFRDSGKRHYQALIVRDFLAHQFGVHITEIK